MKIIKTFSFILILFVVIIFGINFSDRELRPEAQEIIMVGESLRNTEELEKDNAYYAILGFKAPEGMDIVQAGNRAHEHFYSSVLSSTQTISASSESIIGSAPPFPKPIDIPQCKLEKPGCLAFYDQNKEKIQQLLGDNTLLLERYTQLKTYAGYKDHMRYILLASWADLTTAIYAAHVLSIAKAANMFHDGQKQDAMEFLAEDLVLWRKLLAGTADIAGKTFSHLALMRGYTLLEEMVASLPPGVNELNDRVEVLSPLKEEEKSYGLVIDGYIQSLHWNLVHHLHPLTQMEMNLASRYFFKTNATINVAYDIFNSMKLVSEAEPGRLNQEMAIQDKKILKTREKGIDWIYNPLGKNFLATSFDSVTAAQWNNTVQALDAKISSLRERLGSTHK